MVTPTPTSLQILKNLHYKSRLSLKTRVNLGGSPTNIRIRIINSPWGFQIFSACAANNWLKLHVIVVQFAKFLDIQEIGHGEVNFKVEFYTGSSLMTVLRMCTKSGQNGSKSGQNSGYVRNRARKLNFVQY